MNKTLLTAASALVLTMAVATSASARDGFYLAVRGGVTNYNLNAKDDNSTTKAMEDYGNVWNVSGALGYKYKYVRIEGEYIYRDDVDDSYATTTPTTAATVINHKVTMESDSFMANMYLDLMPNYWISPYVAGGLGLTRLSVKNVSNDGGATLTDDADNFTWMLGAGLSLRLNRCINLDGGYRYLDMGDIGGANINAHEVYGGLRFTF